MKICWLFCYDIINFWRMRTVPSNLSADVGKIDGSAFLAAHFCGINAEVTFDRVVDGGEGEGRCAGAEIFHQMTHDLIVAAAVLTDLTARGGINDFGVKAVASAFACEHTDLEFVVFENTFDFAVGADDMEVTFCSCASADEIERTHRAVFKGYDDVLVVHDIAAAVISATAVCGVFHIFDLFFSCDRIDRLADTCPSLEGHGVTVEVDLHSGIVAGLLVRTVEAERGRAFGCFIHGEVFAEAKAGYEFRTGCVGKPAHKVHIVAAFCEKETGAAFFFVIPFAANEGVDEVCHADVLGHFDAADSADLAVVDGFLDSGVERGKR